uniref:prostate and testis expressed protein 2-like n=1 Tax=Ictidomys tridecemlineatus TaxID=43179 RepID=UPI001A9EA159|nr:prostate and testis expressed protein 2-like [Ictidomys tridecemlineatus]
MENLLKLCLFLFCMEIAVALECLQCSGYKNGKCEHEVKQCIAKTGESCMITRLWTWPHNESDPLFAESKCMKDCQEENEYTPRGRILTICCDYYDFCNEFRWPVPMP